MTTIEELCRSAARTLNASYALNRTARVSGKQDDIWAFETALVCARREVQQFADAAGITYDSALREAQAIRHTVGALTVPVRV